MQIQNSHPLDGCLPCVAHRSALVCSPRTAEGDVRLSLIAASSLTLSDCPLLPSGIQGAGKKTKHGDENHEVEAETFEKADDVCPVGVCLTLGGPSVANEDRTSG